MAAQPRRGPPPQAPKVNCTACGTTRFMEFECVLCCLRWLGRMNRDTMAANAPVIAAVAGTEHLEAVREAFRASKRGK
jgi:hypothetical protein